MSNMSYCRFQNTDSDLSDCQSALESLIEEGHDGFGKLSHNELNAAVSLVQRCFDIAAMVSDATGEDIDYLLTNPHRISSFVKQLNKGA